MSAQQIKVISSMATRQVLADLAAQCEAALGVGAAIESVGGVDAARRVRAGEVFDAVVLAANVIDQLIESGHLVAGSRIDLVRSGVAVAVRDGAARPDISDEKGLMQAVLGARSLSYSTGPSGLHLASLFERWGIAEQIKSRIVQAPPGVPVGTLVARGEVEIGFQQLSELMHLPGIQLLGPLPGATQIMTTFSGALSVHSQQPDVVRRVLAFMASPAGDAARHSQGMEPARP